MITEAFRKALTEMHKDNEFEKLAAYTETKTDKQTITRYAEGIAKYGADNLPIIPLIMNANADILRDVLTYMINGEKE